MSGWFLLASAIMQYQRKTKLLNYIKKKRKYFCRFYGCNSAKNILHRVFSNILTKMQKKYVSKRLFVAHLLLQNITKRLLPKTNINQKFIILWTFFLSMKKYNLDHDKMSDAFYLLSKYLCGCFFFLIKCTYANKFEKVLQNKKRP